MEVIMNTTYVEAKTQFPENKEYAKNMAFMYFLGWNFQRCERKEADLAIRFKRVGSESKVKQFTHYFKRKNYGFNEV